MASRKKSTVSAAELDVQGVINEALGFPGRMLSGSKSAYANAHPTHRVFFNGNVYDLRGNKLWYGDVDLTRDAAALARVARAAGGIFVTREMPYRFDQVTVQQLEAGCLGEFPSAVRIDP